MCLQKTVFNYLTFYHDYFLENNSDYCYLEISNDGGITWNNLLRFTGLNADSISINISSFIGENVIIRWRIKTDVSGSSSYYKIRDICINGKYDITPPITTGLISGNRLRGWFSSPVKFMTTSTDDASGIDTTYYSINSGPIYRYYGPIMINNEGEFFIEYWSEDKVGNKEEKQIMNAFKIDMSPPEITLTKPEKGLYFLGKKIFLVDKILIIGGFTFQALAEDTYSNIYKVNFLLDDVEFYNTKIAPYRAYCSERHVGRGVIKVIAEDFAGNINSDNMYLSYNKYW